PAAIRTIGRPVVAGVRDRGQDPARAGRHLRSDRASRGTGNGGAAGGVCPARSSRGFLDPLAQSNQPFGRDKLTGRRRPRRPPEDSAGARVRAVRSEGADRFERLWLEGASVKTLRKSPIWRKSTQIVDNPPR